MGMRSLRKWLLRSTSGRVERHPGDGVVLMVSPELRQAIGEKTQELTGELRLASAIEAAFINERHATGSAGDLQPNVFITCPALLGTFKFSPEETERRIRKAFPGLDNKAVKASIRHLADRVVVTLTDKTIPDPELRRSWVHGWADDRAPFSRL